ncbi:hypothetical protein V6N13_065099 [Hibiscus sabdariffa]|uniref:Uncharacterized protein n=1 Tax=Hibiscus sabdariffa TaxID=183260 RepID=A0ABR2QRS2_9ROSI
MNQVSLALAGSALVQAIWSSMRLAAIGRGQSMEGRVLFVPPGPVAAVVSEEQHRWLESLPARSDGPEDG